MSIPDGSIHLSRTQPLVIDVDLAKIIGLNEAIILNQIRWWTEDTTSGRVVNGQRWIYNTYEGWQKNFPFWSVSTIRRTISRLGELDLILERDDLNLKPSDRTKWYALNFDNPAFAKGVNTWPVQNEQMDCSKWTDGLFKMNKSSIAENTTENTTEIMPDPFDTFYAAYPKKVGKGAARRSFAKAIKSASLDTLLAALESQKQSRQWKENNGQFIPHPATWLNQERWEDEAETAVSVSKAPVITEDDPYQVRAYLGNGPWEIGTDEHGKPIFTSDLRTYYEHKFPEAL